MIKSVKKTLAGIDTDPFVSDLVLRQAKAAYENGRCFLLSGAGNVFEFTVDDSFNDFEVRLEVGEDRAKVKCSCRSGTWCRHSVAALMQLADDLDRNNSEKTLPEGIRYTREGMIKRVISERKARAVQAEYRLEFSDNIYGEHSLFNEKEKVYRLTFRDLNSEYGYCSCPDYRSNKLGTCKHLMFAFHELRKYDFLKKKAERQDYPFLEIHLDPFKDYRVSRFYPGILPDNLNRLVDKYFGNETHIPDSKLLNFLGFIDEAAGYKQILIRPDVLVKVEDVFNKSMLAEVRQNQKIDYSGLKIPLFPYQTEGVEFAVFRDGAVIADEMGLGKTVQGIVTAVIKKQLFGFKRSLIICPASVKEQWKTEIEKFTSETVQIADGTPEERAELYRRGTAFFLIVSYETVLRDLKIVSEIKSDFIILDEAQRIKNYESVTSYAIKSLSKKHALVITGTPIESSLSDLYSVIDFIDPFFLSPLWEFSYRHCIFDPKDPENITGYYNLGSLQEKLKNVLIRREKKDVLLQLPNLSMLDVSVEMEPVQEKMHQTAAAALAAVLAKKYLTPYDRQRLLHLLSRLRMVCDSTNLLDEETNISPKLKELDHILTEKINVAQEGGRKVVIFSEWKRMLHLIAKMLREKNIHFAQVNGSTTSKKREEQIQLFENRSGCNVLLTTEDGAKGLNLQMADTLINFDLPWNSAQKSERIGRIDRIGQRNKNLTVINLITARSIESKIAEGLRLKQSLFDSVLGEGKDSVDFSDKGKALFINDLYKAVEELSKKPKVSKPAAEKPAKALPQIGIPFEKEAAKAEIPAEKPLPKEPSGNELQEIMKHGFSFLGGLFKMMSGQELPLTEQKFSFDPETGEVVMRFKMPKNTEEKK